MSSVCYTCSDMSYCVIVPRTLADEYPIKDMTLSKEGLSTWMDLIITLDFGKSLHRKLISIGVTDTSVWV